MSLKIETKTSIEEQSEGEEKATWPIDENNPKKMLYRKREISVTPIQLHLKELYGECYPHTVAPSPEMKAVTYTGKTFGRCQYLEVYDMFSRQTCNQPGMTLVPSRIFQVVKCVGVVSLTSHEYPL